MDPSQRKEDLKKGQELNAQSISAKFRTKRFFLDVAGSRFNAIDTNNVFGAGIKSFWVSDTNNKSFVAKIVPNHQQDRDKTSGLPLRPNMNQSFEFPLADACLEFASQPGIWVDITFSESEDISIGSIEASLTATSTVREGEAFTQSQVTVDAVGPFVVLFPANGSRGVGYARNTSATQPIYVGTTAELNDANYKTICRRIMPNNDFFEWRNSAELRARVETTTAIAQVMDQTV